MRDFLLLVFLFSILTLKDYGQDSTFGIVMNGGFGVESFPVFRDQNGNAVNLSTGSGFSIGVEYGHNLHRGFNISANSMFQISTIPFVAENAYARFTRIAITLTPALSLPIRKDSFLKMRIGAGPGIYSFGTLKIDGSKIGGEKMILKYKPAVGFHTSILLLIRVEEDGYIGLGGKYYRISYTFQEKGSTHFSTDDRINNPDASGVGVIMGFFGRF